MVSFFSALITRHAMIFLDPPQHADSKKMFPQVWGFGSWGAGGGGRLDVGNSFWGRVGGSHPGPHAHGNTARQAMDGLWTEAHGRQKQSNDPGNNQHNPKYTNYWAPLTRKAHPATFSTAPTHQRLGSANAETTPAGAPAAAADRKQPPDATCEGKNG